MHFPKLQSAHASYVMHIIYTTTGRLAKYKWQVQGVDGAPMSAVGMPSAVPPTLRRPLTTVIWSRQDPMRIGANAERPEVHASGLHSKCDYIVIATDGHAGA